MNLQAILLQKRCITCHRVVMIFVYILCQEFIRVTSSKSNLWRVVNEKTAACLDLEECIGVNISKNQDFQVICHLCLNVDFVAVAVRVISGFFLRNNDLSSEVSHTFLCIYCILYTRVIPKD